MICGLPAALSVMVTVPVSTPVVVGVNVTLIAHFFPAGMVAPQLVVSPKLALATMLLTVSAEVPLFVSVTDLKALVVPTVWFPKSMVLVESVTMGPAASAVAQSKAGIARDLRIFMTTLLGDAARTARRREAV